MKIARLLSGALLAACVQAAFAQTPQCQPSPYYPECSGTHRFYTSRQITAAHWDDEHHAIVIDATRDQPNNLGAILTFQFFASRCNGKQYQGESWSFHGWNGYASDWAEAKAHQMNDGVFMSTRGVYYIGEAGGGAAGYQLDMGEPELTLNPIAGEHVHTDYRRNAACGQPFEDFREFSTDYWTVGHDDVWTSPAGIQYHDVWQTTLVENFFQDATRKHLVQQKYYQYRFARGTGQVYGACWYLNRDEPSTPQTYTDCGVEYQLEPGV
jgi:hypothetical protein